jgi:H+/gluconate symporter-like permease
MVPEFGLPLEILILSMVSDAFVSSYVPDPFFWILGELAGMESSEIFRLNILGYILMCIVSFLLVSVVIFLLSFSFTENFNCSFSRFVHDFATVQF